jgi:hypothetical protein
MCHAGAAESFSCREGVRICDREGEGGADIPSLHSTRNRTPRTCPQTFFRQPDLARPALSVGAQATENCPSLKTARSHKIFCITSGCRDSLRTLAKVGTKDDSDLQMREGHKGYGMGLLLGHRAYFSLSYGPKF